VGIETAPAGVYRIPAPLARPINGMAFRKDLDQFEKWAGGWAD
jgi:hypothetical protein